MWKYLKEAVSGEWWGILYKLIHHFFVSLGIIYSFVNTFIVIVSKAVIKHSYEANKLLNKVITMSSSHTSISKHASWYANALTLLAWSNKSSPSYILHVKNLRWTKRMLDILFGEHSKTNAWRSQSVKFANCQHDIICQHKYFLKWTNNTCWF